MKFAVIFAFLIVAVAAVADHERKLEDYHAEPAEMDHEAAYYKSSDDQFRDLHERMQALTHHLATVQGQLGKLYERVNELHWRDDENREEHRRERVARGTIDGMDARLKEVEKIALQIAGALTSKDYTQHFEDLRRTLQEHHHTLLDSVPHTVSHALATGGPRMGTLLVIVVLLQVGWAAAYVVYKSWKKTKRNKYL